MADFGTTFLPAATTEEERRRRAMQQGDAMRVLAMTLPQSLGPGAIAPDILLNAQGMAGVPMPPGMPGGGMPGSGGGAGMGGNNALASLIAQAIVDQVSGTSPSGPLGGLQSGLPLGGGAPAAPPPSTPLTGAQSLTGLVRQEAQAPTGRTTVAAPSFGGVSTQAPMPAPRVIPRDTPSGPDTPINTIPTPQPVPPPDTMMPGEQPDGSLLTTDPVPNLSDILSLLRMDRTPRQRFGG